MIASNGSRIQTDVSTDKQSYLVTARRPIGVVSVSSLFCNFNRVLFVFSRTLTSHAEVYLRSRTYQALVKITLKVTKTNKK